MLDTNLLIKIPEFICLGANNLPDLLRCCKSLYNLSDGELFNQNKFSNVKWKERLEQQTQMISTLDKDAIENLIMENEEKVEDMEQKIKRVRNSENLESVANSTILRKSSRFLSRNFLFVFQDRWHF